MECCFKILLHHAGKILDKPVLNHEKVLDAVNDFKGCAKEWMFTSHLIKHDKNEKNCSLVFTSARYRSIDYFNYPPDGWKRLLLGRRFKIRLR